jgi:excisionase family DNA binding protein
MSLAPLELAKRGLAPREEVGHLRSGELRHVPAELLQAHREQLPVGPLLAPLLPLGRRPILKVLVGACHGQLLLAGSRRRLDAPISDSSPSSNISIMGNPAMSESHLHFPTREAAAQAAAALEALRGTRRRVSLSVQRSRERVEIDLPDEAIELLRVILMHMAEGSAVVAVHAELVTQEAADLLAVSRPFLVRLLEEGAIPHRKVGAHRRILASDLLAYRKREDLERRDAARKLTEEAQRLGIDS